jgi:hypothetical protein
LLRRGTAQAVQQVEPWALLGIALGTLQLLRSDEMTLSTLLLIILILALFGALPSWPYSRSWGYGPSGLVGVLLVVVLVLALLGRAPA